MRKAVGTWKSCGETPGSGMLHELDWPYSDGELAVEVKSRRRSNTVARPITLFKYEEHTQ
jgi:hypothetical protein